MTLERILLWLLLVYGLDAKFTCLEDGEFEHPHSCYRYYTCRSGVATIAKCKNRFYWKPTGHGKGSCASAEDVKCNKRPKSVAAVSNGGKWDRSSSVDIKIGDSFNKPYDHDATDQMAPAFECPAWSGHYRDPTDCSRFFLCVDGTKYGYTCPVGMHFSLAGHCDFVYRVHCAMEREAQSITNDLWSVENQQAFDLASIIEMNDYDSSGDLYSTKSNDYFSYENAPVPDIMDWDTESMEEYDSYEVSGQAYEL